MTMHKTTPAETNPAWLQESIPGPKTSESQPFQARRRRPRLVKWYWRSLWVVAVLMIYMVVVEFQITGTAWTLLNQSGQINAQHQIILAPFRESGQKFCMYITPQGVNFSTMLYASWPGNWGPKLYAFLKLHYCNVTYAQLNIVLHITDEGSPANVNVVAVNNSALP